MRVILEMEAGARAPVEAVCTLAAKLKLHGVLLPLPAVLLEPEGVAEAACARWRQTAKAHGVAIAGLAGVLSNAARQLAGGETTRAAARVRLQTVIRLCTDLGARLACCELPAWETLRGRLRVEQAETLRACAPLAESRRVALCLEGDPGVTEKLVQKVNHPNIRLACHGAAWERLAKPAMHTRLVWARLADDPARLGRQLVALGYNQWLALRLGSENDRVMAETWLEKFNAAFFPRS